MHIYKGVPIRKKSTYKYIENQTIKKIALANSQIRTFLVDEKNAVKYKPEKLFKKTKINAYMFSSFPNICVENPGICGAMYFWAKFELRAKYTEVYIILWSTEFSPPPADNSLAIVVLFRFDEATNVWGEVAPTR